LILLGVLAALLAGVLILFGFGHRRLVRAGMRSALQISLQCPPRR
jgi:hypothetical protein